MFFRRIAAKSARSIFFEEYNDIDIYIEDRALGNKKLVKELLKKSLGSEVKIEQIFPLGSRDEVITECWNNQHKTGRKRIYIVDGDLYLISGSDVAGLTGLYVLPRYCIENFLIDEESLIELAYEEDPIMEIEEVRTNLNFSHWLEYNQALLTELFIIYALCFKHMPEEQTVGYKVSKLCSSNSGLVCNDKVVCRIAELKKKLVEKIGEVAFRTAFEHYSANLIDHEYVMLKCVSGKDYLLPLLVTRLKSFLKFPNLNSSIKIRLALKLRTCTFPGLEASFID